MMSKRLSDLVRVTGYVLAFAIGSANAQTVDPRKAWHTVEIACPADNGGALTTRKRNEVGQTWLLQVRYRNGTAVSVTVEHPPASDRHMYDLLGEQNSAVRDVGALVVAFAEKDLSRYCGSSPAEREAARAELEANRRKYGF